MRHTLDRGKQRKHELRAKISPSLVQFVPMLTRLGSLRTAIAVLTGIAALYMGLVVFNNITDFPTNRAFVEHVLAMDTTFKSPNTMWRAITSPGLQLAAYILIIVWEALTAIVLAIGCVMWIRGSARARSHATVGWLMMMLLFGGGFIAIGGEWFEMWQSQQWNGLQPAVFNFLIASAGLIVTQLKPQSP
jgi:predicted small integral membrane protein